MFCIFSAPSFISFLGDIEDKVVRIPVVESVTYRVAPILCIALSVVLIFHYVYDLMCA